MIWLRSVLFNLWFYGTTTLLGLAAIPVMFGPGHWSMQLANYWVRIALSMLRPICGIRTEIRGLEHIPKDRAVVFASKHQSAWETMIYVKLFGDPVYVQKKELLKIPLFGTYTHKAGMISIDRGAGRKAVADLVAQAKDRLSKGRHIVIFPQGTRTAPGRERPYKSGVASLYTELGATVIPVALNSGQCWGRNAFYKRPGRIIMEFLPPMPEGLERDAFMKELEQRIESATARLMAENA